MAGAIPPLIPAVHHPVTPAVAPSTNTGVDGPADGSVDPGIRPWRACRHGRYVQLMPTTPDAQSPDMRHLGWLGFLGLLGFSGFQHPLGFLFFGFLLFFRHFWPVRTDAD